MKKISVLGDGGWGTALAMVLQKNGHTVTVWGPFDEVVRATRADHENKKFLPGVTLPPEIQWTSNHGEAVDEADVVVLASPSKFYGGVVTSFAEIIPKAAVIVSVSKGIHPETYCRLTETAAEVLHHQPIAALSGPSHAEEVARGVPSAVVVGCPDPGVAGAIQETFMSDVFRVYTSSDVTGVELGGAMKNVIAVAAGISDGIGFGDNTKAALLTRGLAEMIRLGTVLGARPETFTGLSGIGDLMVTCASKLSRNRGVGERIGRGESLLDIMDSMEQVAEGVWNCTAFHELARKHQVELPIIEQVYAVVHDGKDPREAVRDLMMRAPRSEEH